jgi:hypothetical protein
MNAIGTVVFVVGDRFQGYNWTFFTNNSKDKRLHGVLIAEFSSSLER